MTIPDFASPDYVAAVDGFVADYVAVVGHVLTDHEHYPWGRHKDELADTALRREVAPLPLLARAVAYTLYTMRFFETYRALTDDEQHIRAAAKRLSAAIHDQETTH